MTAWGGDKGKAEMEKTVAEGGKEDQDGAEADEGRCEPAYMMGKGHLETFSPEYTQM